MRRILLGLTALLVVATLAMGAHAQPSVRGVTANEIVIGSSMPLTGPAAFWGLGLGGGINAYIGMVNAEGGIHGRRLRFVLLDDAYQTSRAVANVRELVERHNVFALVGTVGTANAFAVRNYVVGNKVLWVTPLADASMWAGFRDTSHLFVAYPSFVYEARILTRFAVEQLKTTKIGVFYQNDLFGQKGLLGVRRGLAETRGARLVARTSYEVVQPDVSTQARQLRDSGAEAVVIYATPTHGAAIVREMAKLGYRPKLLATFGLSDPIMFRLGGEAWNDIYTTVYTPIVSDDQRMNDMLQAITRVNPDLARNPFNALGGVGDVEPLVEGLRRAGPNPTAERVIRAMETLKNWDGAVVRRVTFGPKERQGINRLRVVLASNGTYRAVTDWISYRKEF